MTNLPAILALCGKAGSGKSTIAAELVERHGYTVVKFAGPLKAMLRALGLTEEEIEGRLKESPCELLDGHTPRHAMQTLGTEWGRQMISPGLWVSAWRSAAQRVIDSGGKVIVDDCRYQNELLAAQKFGAVAIRLVRAEALGVGLHTSETGLDAIGIPEVANDSMPATVASRVLSAAAIQR